MEARVYDYGNGNDITLDEIFDLINECFSNERSTLNSKGRVNFFNTYNNYFVFCFFFLDLRCFGSRLDVIRISLRAFLVAARTDQGKEAASQQERERTEMRFPI